MVRMATYKCSRIQQEQSHADMLRQIFSVIEDLKEHIENENDYLKSCDNIYELFNFLDNKKKEIESSTYFQRINTETRTRRILSDAAKIESNNWVSCKRCDRLVQDINRHHKTQLCKTIYKSKMGSSIEGTTDISKSMINKKLLEKELIQHRIEYVEEEE